MNKVDFAVGGLFGVQAINPNGSVAWEDTAKNGVVTVGLNFILNAFFGATSKPAAWNMGLISSTGFSALASADTMPSHAGWTENSAGFSQATRPAWTPGSASAGVVSNATTVDFSITSSVTIKGIFLANDSTKGGSTGTLWSTGLFTSGDQSLVNGQTLRVTYTITGTAS